MQQSHAALRWRLLPCRDTWRQFLLDGALWTALCCWTLVLVLQALLLVLRPLLLLALRANVRSQAFWQRGLAFSWCVPCCWLSLCDVQQP